MMHRSLPLALLSLACLSFGLLTPLNAAEQQPASEKPTAPIATNIPAPSAPPPLKPTALPTIAIDEVRRGQRGYGLTVFAGDEPERFEVEVVGVMRNVSPDVSYILARLTGKGLEKIGVAAGMSGSPVFIDGKLAGAVAFSWPFSHEAIAGITPIESMRRLSGLQALPSPMPLPPVPVSDLVARKVPADLLQREIARLKPQLGGGAVASVQWSTIGFGERSLDMLRQSLTNVSAAGEARPGDAPPDLKLGGAVAAVLVDGDFSLAAFGTVTDLYDDQVLAFGHPFLGLGPVRLPMASAEVVTVFSSQHTSFKISNLGQTVGAFEQDRQAGIQGRMGATAPMTPMVLRITGGVGEKPRQFKVRLADVPQLTPLLIGSTVLAGLESASYSTGTQSLDMTARFKLARYGDLEMRQSFDGDNAGTEAASLLLAVSAYLTQNPLEQVELEAVEIEVQQSPLPRTASLVGAYAERTVVRPGERVGLTLDLAAYRGERFRRSLTIDLPEDLPAGKYTLLVGDGASADATRLLLEPGDPVTFRQAFDLLSSFHSRRDLVVLGVFGGPGLSVAGEVMPRLPASVRSVYGAAASGSAVPLRATIAQTRRETLDVPISGLVQVDLEVRRNPVLTGEEGNVDDGAPAAGAEGGR
jgi:hypothetical protein